MNKKRSVIGIIFFLSVFFVKAATVDTLSVYSKSMDKNIKVVIVLPENYKKSDAFPVVYLLHGWSDNYSTWIKKVPALTELSDLYGFIIVMPDGDYNSWYWDSPVDPKSQYETFVSKELVSYIDSNYKTIKNRNGRAITGNSMGGQGAMFLAFRHQDIFGNAGSLSGGLDIRSFPAEWNMSEKLGSYADYPERWEKYAVINQIYRLKPSSLNLIIDCGTEDFFYPVNEEMHKKLLYKNIPHTYITHQGTHDWKFWKEAIKYQFLFFKTSFESK